MARNDDADSDLNFLVLAKNQKCGATNVMVTCTEYLLIQYDGYNVTLGRRGQGRKITVVSPDKATTFPDLKNPRSFPNFTVSQDGRFVRFQSRNKAIMVEYDGSSIFNIELDPILFNKTSGFCGNYDGIGTNDKDWKRSEFWVPDPDKPLQSCDGDVDHPCVKYPKLKKAVEKNCDRLFSWRQENPFLKCFNKDEHLEKYLKKKIWPDCVYDHCAQMTDALRIAGQNLVTECSNEEVTVDAVWKLYVHCDVNVIGPCLKYPNRIKAAQSDCEMLFSQEPENPFFKCIQEVEHLEERIVEDCVCDHCGGNNAHCSAGKKLVSSCKERGVAVNAVWKLYLKCPLNLATALQLIKFSEVTIPTYWEVDLQGNSLVLTNEDTGNLEKFSLSDGFSQTRRVWSVPMPAGMPRYCMKRQSPDGSILLQNLYERNKVVQVDGAGKVVVPWTEWQHGWIIAVTSTMIAALQTVDERSVLTLVARSNHTQAVTLLTGGDWRSYCVCEVPQSGNIIVLDSDRKKLYMFTNDGRRLLRQLDLPYRPAEYKGFACSPEVIAVLDYSLKSVHLHSIGNLKRLRAVDFGLRENNHIYYIAIKDRVVHGFARIDGSRKIYSYVLY